MFIAWRSRRMLFLLGAAFTFCWSTPVNGESLFVPSLELMTCEAQVIAVGKITSTNAVKGPGDVIYEDCTLSVSESIKGPTTKTLEFCDRHLSGSPTWLTAKDDVLVFLYVYKSPYADREFSAKDHFEYETRLHGRLMPIKEQHPSPILELTNLPQDLYSKDATKLTNRTDVLGVVREWSGSSVTHSIGSSMLAGSATRQPLDWQVSDLIIPAEEKYRSYFVALAGSEEPYKRQTAASVLFIYPGDETERILRDLLKDDTENQWLLAADTIPNIEFGVRTAAYRSLRALGKPVPETTLNRKPTAEERRTLRATYWRESFNSALTDDWQVVAVEDGETRPVPGEDRETTLVIVTCSHGETRCRFWLLPKEWGKDPAVAIGEDLGVNGEHSQGARHFMLEGDLPEAVKQKITEHFGLERPKYVQAPSSVPWAFSANAI